MAQRNRAFVVSVWPYIRCVPLNRLYNEPRHTYINVCSIHLFHSNSWTFRHHSISFSSGAAQNIHTAHNILLIQNIKASWMVRRITTHTYSDIYTDRDGGTHAHIPVHEYQCIIAATRLIRLRIGFLILTFAALRTSWNSYRIKHIIYIYICVVIKLMYTIHSTSIEMKTPTIKLRRRADSSS